MSEEKNMSEEKKLHIDEDWKTQVDREKELPRQQTETMPNATAQPAPTPAPTSSDSTASTHAEQALPPASLIILISSLATQAMASMGQLPADDDNPPVDMQFARHFIDLIGVIEDKTRNNLTGEEASFLKNTLLHLRMLFVESSRR